MANEENLIPFDKRSKSEAREYGRRGGKSSGVARRKRKAMKTVLNELLTLPAESAVAQAALGGIDLDGADNQAAILAGLMKAAMAGDVKAVQEIRNILGESRDTPAEKAERKARTEKLQADAAAAQAKVNGDGQERPDDGFIEALRGEAASDWSE